MRQLAMISLEIGLCLAFVGELRAQTQEIQAEVENKLWWQRLYQWIESFATMPVGVYLIMALGLVLVVAILFYLSRRRQRG